jgi:hypothetical protein
MPSPQEWKEDYRLYHRGYKYRFESIFPGFEETGQYQKWHCDQRGCRVILRYEIWDLSKGMNVRTVKIYGHHTHPPMAKWMCIHQILKGGNEKKLLLDTTWYIDQQPPDSSPESPPEISSDEEPMKVPIPIKDEFMFQETNHFIRSSK